MFPMSPIMSWILVISLMLLIAVPLWAMHRSGRRRALKTAQPERLAIVTELRPRPVPAERHVAVVPELRAVNESRRIHLATRPKPAHSTELYDWATQGV